MSFLSKLRWKPKQRAAKNAAPYQGGKERDIIITVIECRNRIPRSCALEVVDRLIASMPSFKTVEQFIDWLEREMFREEEWYGTLPL